MAITRRNTLVLLFVVVAAAGVIGGTGAFSTVEADRSVTVETAGDSSGNVILETNTADHASLTDDGAGDTIGFDFDQVNVDATTKYNDVINVTVNDADSPSGQYNISVDSPAGMNVTFDNGQSYVVDQAGVLHQADITINTVGDTSEDSNEIDDNITFTVTAQ